MTFEALTAAAAILAVVLLIYVFGPTTMLRALAWAIRGTFIGWLGSLILRSDTQSDILLDMVAGAVGMILGLLVYGVGSLTEGGPVERALSAILGSSVLIAVASGIRHFPKWRERIARNP